MTADMPRCALRITTESLSAWRDHVLAADETHMITAHVPICAACQRRLDQFAVIAQAMQRQHVPNLRERVWRGMSPRMTPLRRFSVPRAAILGGLGAALAVTILFAATLTVARQHGGGSHSISLMPTVTATATLAGSPASSRVLTPTQAWGDYASQSVTSAATGGYAIQDIFPDGSAAVGGRIDVSATTDDTVFATIPIAHPTSAHVVYTAPPGASSLFARTDGRFVAWMSTLRDSGGPDAGREFAGYLDLQTQRVATLVDASTTNKFTIAAMVVDHGYMLWFPESGGHPTLAAINMLTGQSTLIAPNLALTTVPALQFSYPYVFFTDDTTAHIYNLTTKHDTLLSQVQVSDVNTFALDGATLFWAHGAANAFVVDEIDQVDQPGAQGQRIADASLTHGQSFPDALAANARLIAWGGATGTFAWDRAQHRLIAVTTVVAESALFLRGATFAYASSSGVAPTYTVIDTTKLPMTAPQ